MSYNAKYWEKNKKLLWAVLLLFCMLYILSVVFRKFNGDEAIIAEWAYWLAKTGTVKSILGTGFNMGYENQVYLYHKLFTIIGAFIIKLFGISIFGLRLISLISFIVFLLLFKTYYKRYYHAESLQYILMITIILMLSNYKFTEYSFMYRPEVLLMTLGFASYLCLDTFLRNNKFKFLFLGSLFAGLGMLTHLNGVIFIISGGVLLFIRKKIKEGIFFGIIAGMVSLLFFFDMYHFEEFKQFLFQLRNAQDLSDVDFKYYGLFIKIMQEPNRFLHSPCEIVFSILLITSLLANFKNLKTRFPNLLIYFLLLFITLGGISHGKTVKYGLLYLPYILIIISYTLYNIKDLSIPWSRTIVVSLIIYVGLNTFLIGKSLEFVSFNVSKRNAMIASKIPVQGTKVFSNSAFIFNEIDKFQIHSSWPLRFSEEYKNANNKKDYFFNYLDELQIDYIIKDQILNNDFMPHVIEFEDLKQGEIYYNNYLVLLKTNDFVILEKQKL